MNDQTTRDLIDRVRSGRASETDRVMLIGEMANCFAIQQARLQDVDSRIQRFEGKLWKLLFLSVAGNLLLAGVKISGFV